MIEHLHDPRQAEYRSNHASGRWREVDLFERKPEGAQVHPPRTRMSPEVRNFQDRILWLSGDDGLARTVLDQATYDLALQETRKRLERRERRTIPYRQLGPMGRFDSDAQAERIVIECLLSTEHPRVHRPRTQPIVNRLLGDDVQDDYEGEFVELTIHDEVYERQTAITTYQ